MSTDEKRFLRREIINSHLWTMQVNYGWDVRFNNIRLMVRLYERQFYNQELSIYSKGE